MFERKQLIGANFSFQHYPFSWVAEQISGMGFDRMELWGIAPHLDLFHDTRRRLPEVKAILRDNGLTIRCFTPEQVLYPINIASADEAYREASVQRFLNAAEICAELGGQHLFLTPGRGFEGEGSETAWRHSVDSINRIVTFARSLGVSCLLEPLQRFESNIANNVDDLYSLWKSIDGDDVDIVLDFVAMAAAGDSVDGYFERFGDRVAHVHVVDGVPSGHLAWGEGNLPLEGYIADLAKHRYQGTLTFEPFGDGSYALDPVPVWRRCLRAVAPYFKEAAEP